MKAAFTFTSQFVFLEATGCIKKKQKKHKLKFNKVPLSKHNASFHFSCLLTFEHISLKSLSPNSSTTAVMFCVCSKVCTLLWHRCFNCVFSMWVTTIARKACSFQLRNFVTFKRAVKLTQATGKTYKPHSLWLALYQEIFHQTDLRSPV